MSVADEEEEITAFQRELNRRALDLVKAGELPAVAIAKAIAKQVDITAAFPRQSFERLRKATKDAHLDALVLAAGMALHWGELIDLAGEEHGPGIE